MRGLIGENSYPDNHSFQTSYMESAFSNEQVPEGKGNKMDKRVCVNIHSKRKRLADTDGCSVKAVFDALTKVGIWPDDSAKFIKKVSFTQERSDIEETIITIRQES